MFRVRLSSGEEAVYRSVEELALGISSGVVTDQAEIFHTKQHHWVPIQRHPEFEAARARASALMATPEPPPPKAGEVGAAEAGGPQVYQMYSYSARELAERRRRPRWRQHVVTIAAGILFLVSLALVAVPERTRIEQTFWPGRSGVPAKSPQHGTGSGPSSAAASERLRAPYNLANRLSRAQTEAGLILADSAAGLGLTRLLGPGRLTSPDSLRLNLTALERFRPVVINYRARLRELRQAYRDTAETLAQSGAWDRLEVQEWQVRVNSPEYRSDALQADSLAITLTALFSLLAAEPPRPPVTTGLLTLSSDSAGLVYDRLRADLRRFRALDYQRTRRVPPPLQALLTAIGTDSLPPRRPL